jgi:transposase
MIHPTNQVNRFIAVDAHKHYLVIGGLDKQMEIVLPLRRIDIHRFPDWAQKHLLPSDAVVIEASTNTWTLYDVIVPLVARITVANPYKVRLIAASKVKTDKLDVWALARLLVADLIPEVWVPPLHVRELRALISHRRRLSHASARIRNRLHSVLHRHNLKPPTARPFSPKHTDWWTSLPLSPSESLRVRQDLETLHHVKRQLHTVDDELTGLTTIQPWSSSYPFLIQLPGFGLVLSMTILSAIGDISRFPSPKKLVGYSGLGASVHDSGKTQRTGRITKQGRKDLRWALVEAAWSAVRYHPHWKAHYQRLSRRMHPNKAIVAVARKLLVVVWHVLTEATADRHADQEMVAFKLMLWAWKLGEEQRGGLTTPQFVRKALMKLETGEALTHIVRGGTKRPIATTEEVLALTEAS